MATEIDSDAGSLATDFKGSQAFRQETLRFVNCCLGLAPEGNGREPSSRIVRSFEVIGEAIRKAYDVGKQPILRLWWTLNAASGR